MSKILSNKRPIEVWGDGSPIRDFIHASDVARAMIFVMENGIDEPVNVIPYR